MIEILTAQNYATDLLVEDYAKRVAKGESLGKKNTQVVRKAPIVQTQNDNSDSDDES